MVGWERQKRLYGKKKAQREQIKTNADKYFERILEYGGFILKMRS